ncbi:MAG: hypothetical protein C0412_12730 [Flavobacterium sp.]|nr:hypothetical protein [Flavobacterium sp.]
MNKRFFFISSLFVLLSGQLSAQIVKENWELVALKAGSKISIDLNGLDKYKEDEIYVWVIEEHASPIIIESVPKKIYKTKTYYLLNKNLKRYGIIQLLYYDEKGNVLKHFSYFTGAKDNTYKYSYPILPDSNVELILTRCLEKIKK